MKRRTRKRKPKPKQDSETAKQPALAPSPPEASVTSEVEAEMETPANDVELQEEFTTPATILQEQPASQTLPPRLPAPSHSEPTSSPPASDPADRRAHPRYTFAASAEVVAIDSGAWTQARVRDLSEQGCYLDTENPIPLGATTIVRITKGEKFLEAKARVVYNQPRKGMGLMFIGTEQESLLTLGEWIAETRETSWLAANRRRSQRVLMKIPVGVSVQAPGLPFDEEDTYTLAVSAHGALIAFSTPVYRGQRLTLSNPQTKAKLECIVVHIRKLQDQEPQIGVEFLLPNPTFWRVAFPPKDWTPRHPDAKCF